MSSIQDCIFKNDPHLYQYETVDDPNISGKLIDSTSLITNESCLFSDKNLYGTLYLLNLVYSSGIWEILTIDNYEHSIIKNMYEWKNIKHNIEK